VKDAALFIHEINFTLPFDNHGLTDSFNLESLLRSPLPAGTSVTAAAATLPTYPKKVPPGIFFSREATTIIFVDMQFLPVTSDAWDRMQPERVLAKTAALNPPSSGEGTFISTAFQLEELPKTFLFKTRSGEAGLLQITGLATGSSGVNFRYKMAQNGITSGTNVENPRFGNNHYYDFSPRQWLDMATGKTLRMPQSVSASDNPIGLDYVKAADWAKTEILQLALDKNTNDPSSLVSFGMKMIRLEQDDFRDITPTQLLEELNHEESVLPNTSASDCVRFGSHVLPAVFGFKSRDGLVGMLEITGYSTSPYRVMISYKLIESIAD
jgi:hypothetical protein